MEKDKLLQLKEELKDVTLVAVSKTYPYEDIKEAYDCGQRIFGENRVQEIEAKFPKKDERPRDMKLLLIGHLQTNKVKKAVSLVDRIDSVDSIKLLNEIIKEAEKKDIVMPILLEVNSSNEENKSGFTDKEELLKAAELAFNNKFITLEGLMTVGPLTENEKDIKNAFSFTKNLYDELKVKYNLSVLSMGMSSDYPLAIEKGSTEVRIGSLIFGKRNYSV